MKVEGKARHLRGASEIAKATTLCVLEAQLGRAGSGYQMLIPFMTAESRARPYSPGSAPSLRRIAHPNCVDPDIIRRFNIRASPSPMTDWQV